MEEILHQLIGSLSHYLQGSIHPRWCRSSSINRVIYFYMHLPRDTVSLFWLESDLLSRHTCIGTGPAKGNSQFSPSCWRIYEYLSWSQGGKISPQMVGCMLSRPNTDPNTDFIWCWCFLDEEVSELIQVLVCSESSNCAHYLEISSTLYDLILFDGPAGKNFLQLTSDSPNPPVGLAYP